MRLNRSLYILLRLPLFCVAANSLRAQCTNESLTLGANPSSLLPGQTATLSALVKCSGGSPKTDLLWTFSPAVAGAVPGAATTTLDPVTGISANTYAAPAQITVAQSVKVTVQTADGSNLTASATITLTSPLDVGTGAPTPSLQNAFISAFFRNNFNNLVLVPPVGIVKRLGTTGYVQEFTDKNSAARLALATAPSPAEGTPVSIVQLLGDLYTYYTSVGAATAGLPLLDTQFCPFFDPANGCTYDIFDKNYALFAYRAPLATGTGFTIRLLFFTEWTKQGGITGLGRPVDIETAITAAVITGTTPNTATVQAYSGGGIYSITSGPNNGLAFSVLEPIYDLYIASGGPSSNLGLPTGERFTLTNGDIRQNFEGGAVQYTPGGGPTLRLPVAAVSLSGAGVAPGAAITLNLGQTLALTAAPVTSAGTLLTDRVVSWTTTNNRVLQIQANNLTAVVKAVGGGSASLTASSEGVSSPKLIVNVISPCCQIGDGAPTAVQQAFQSALTRNKIAVQTPVASPAVRAGNGYVQTVQSSDTPPVTYLLAQSDRLGTAFVLSGAVLNAYQGLGSAAGALGYPISDQTAGGTQQFENSAALGGSPVRLVGGVILSKWALMSYENGPAGAPAADAGSFSTFGANSGVAQSFANGAIYGVTAGPRNGQAYYVSGLILARYNAIGGAGGAFGMPVTDEFVTGSVHQQNFEGGNITWSTGDQAAVEHAAPKSPGVIVSPASLAAGARARLAVVGFPNNSTIRVSFSGQIGAGQPDFVVNTATGAYSWDMFFPLTSKSGTVTIHAADSKGATADGSLTVRSFADNRVPITKIQGDNQTGAPGALAPLGLRVALRDASGDPVVGARVVFQASPGAQVSAPGAVTDSNGQAETFVRLPAAEGITLVNVDAVNVDGTRIAQNGVTFGLRSAASSLTNFPKLKEAGDAPLGNGTATIGQKGALLTAVASILRYHQNRGELPAPNGTADPATLNAFLKAYCLPDSKGNQNCDGFLSNPPAPSNSGEQIVNLWRAAEFTGGVDISIESPTPGAIADLVAQGWPVLLSLGLSLNGTVAGGHFVVATGVAADGSIAIQDPNPWFARTSLNDYLTGFSAAGFSAAGFSAGNATWKADLRGAVRFALRSPGATRFLLAALSQPAGLMSSLATDVSSGAGACGHAIQLLDAVDSLGNASANGALISRIVACDGGQPVYQIGIGISGGGISGSSPQPFQAFVTDLAPGGSTSDLSGSAAAVYKATRPQLTLAIAPQDISFTASAVVNAATFTAGIAPGGIMAIFGAGLAGAASPTSVDIDGIAVRLVYTSPFQINAEVPLATSPGAHNLHIQSAYGSAQQQVTVSAVAPEIFLVGNPAAAGAVAGALVGALVNQDNSLNGPSNPLGRGQVLVIYATGLGAVVKSGQLSVAAAPVTVVLNGTELAVNFAGLTPGYIGLYQVNVLIPASTPPGLAIPLTLKQGNQGSNSTPVAIQ